MPVTINGTTGITTPNLNSAGTVTTLSLVNGTALSFRNKIINGNFAINQRGYVSGTATSGANQYTLDRWRVVTSGQNLTFTASGTGNIVTAPAGGIEQVIESLNIEGGTYTLSWTGTATATINGSAIVNGGQATLPANTNATIRFTSGTVSLVQLEEGSVVTPFENLHIGTELALCQRYYYELPSGATNSFILSGGQQNNSACLCPVYHPVVMRTSPTLTVSGVAADYYVIVNNTTVLCSSIPFITGMSSPYGTALSFTASASVGFASWGAAANSSAKLSFSAEL